MIPSNQLKTGIQSTLSKMDILVAKKTCPSDRGLRHMEVSLERELIVFADLRRAISKLSSHSVSIGLVLGEKSLIFFVPWGFKLKTAIVVNFTL